MQILREKLVFVFTLSFYVQQYTLWRSALLCTRWGSALEQLCRREARATGSCCDEGLRLSSSCNNKLIPASLTSHSRQSSERGASASAQGMSCRATVRLVVRWRQCWWRGCLEMRTMTPVAEKCRRSQAAGVMEARLCSTCWKACALRELSACLTCLCYVRNIKNELWFCCADANENACLFWSDGAHLSSQYTLTPKRNMWATLYTHICIHMAFLEFLYSLKNKGSIRVCMQWCHRRILFGSQKEPFC